MEYVYEYDSPMGRLTLSSDGECLTGLWIENQKYFKSTLDSETEEKQLGVFDDVITYLDRYFKGEKPEINFKLKPKGSAFRQKIWQMLLEIPYGETTSYGKIAKALEAETGKRVSAQAVGGAIGHNSILILVPCHRVIGSDGSLTGYAGGIDKKQYLLDWENRNKSI